MHLNIIRNYHDIQIDRLLIIMNTMTNYSQFETIENLFIKMILFLYI